MTEFKFDFRTSRTRFSGDVAVTAVKKKMKRIQRKRVKGWRMPVTAIYVGRPSKWGNPYSLEFYGRQASLENYRFWLRTEILKEPDFVEQLRGFDLVCWCPLTLRCHADILLEVLQAEVISQK